MLQGVLAQTLPRKKIAGALMVLGKLCMSVSSAEMDL
jgi:hypothetical protein